MNKMAEVAKLLGLEIGQEFRIDMLEGNFEIGEEGLLNDNCDVKYVLHGLITGEFTIKVKSEKEQLIETLKHCISVPAPTKCLRNCHMENNICYMNHDCKEYLLRILEEN